MFDVVVAASPEVSFSMRVTAALREARIRVVPYEVTPGKALPGALRVDAAVACARSERELSSLAYDLRAALDGAPPVVGITSGERFGPAGGLVDVLSSDASAGTLAARVLRAAAVAERRRAKVVLSGNLADVGADALLASLVARGRSCVVRIRTSSSRAEISLEGGQVVHARADGVGGHELQAVLQATGLWDGASFEVLVESDASAEPRSSREPSVPTSAARPPSREPAPTAIAAAPSARPPLGEPSSVALAAAVLNAVAAYARTWLGLDVAGALLERTRRESGRASPGLDAFAVSRDGQVSVTSVRLAGEALPDGLARWTVALFDEGARVMPLRFRRNRINEALGGLGRLVEQAGWAAALEGRR